MADNYTPEEIQSIFEAYNNALKSGTPISADLARAMKDAASGIRDHTAKVDAAWKKLGTSATDLTKNLYKGEQGAKVFGDAVETAGTALEAMILLIPGVGIAAKVAAVAIGALAKGANAAAKQGDQLYKTYQDLNKIGAATAGGMSDVFDNMQKFGYGLEELDKMTSLIQQNAEALSNFGGTVGSGARAFSKAADEIQHSEIGKSLQMLGKTPDDINKGIAGFVKQQTLLGRGQADVNKDLVAGSAAYVKNLDLLSRLTGLSADQLQAKQEQALAEDAYNQTQYELKKKADAGDQAAAQKYQANIDIASRLTGTALKEFQQGVGGDLSAMSKTMMTASGAVSVLGKTTYTADEYLQALKDGADKSRASLGGLAKFNATNDFLLPMQEIGQIQAKYADETADQITARARLEQDLKDPATKAATELRISQQVARDQLQSFVQLGVNPATQALNKLAGGAAGLSKVLPGQSGTSGAMGGGSNRFMGGSFDQQKATPGTSGSMGALLNLIGQGESKGNYNALVYGKKGANTPGSADLTNMTIAQVQEYQKGMIGRGHASTAVGKYQMIADTLAEQVKKSGLDPNTTKFDQKTQDQLASQLVKQAGYGNKDSATVMKNLAGTWASLPKDMSGRGAYDGFNGNQAGIRPGELMAAISGPTGNYQSSLAGVKPETSTVQPAAQQAPVTNQTDHNEKMTGLLLSMNDQLAQLNKVNRNQLDVQQKTLQRQT